MQNTSMQDEKILLILDIDETLIHASEDCFREDYDFRVFDYFVYKRPFLREFLQFCNQYFTLAVWSSSGKHYLQKVVQEIFPPEISLAFAWGREKCTPIFMCEEYAHQPFPYEYAKILKKVKKKGFSLKKMLIVDDTPAKVKNAYGNAIYPLPFEGNPNDNELPKLMQYLLTLKDAQNVRNIEKRNWRTAQLA